jgi:hypothetical protein
MPLQKKVIVGFAGLIGILLLLLAIAISFSSLVTAEGSEVTVSIGDIEVSPNGFVKAPLMVRNVTALGAGEICITYDSTQVHVTAVTEGEGNALLIAAWNSNNSVNPGYVRIASYSVRTFGGFGDVIFADVTFKGVGAAGNTSALNISVESLFSVINYADIPFDTENGSLSISETTFTEFDTGSGTYPSISGIHTGSIIPSWTINVSKIYTYPCEGTGGHAEYAKIWNSTWNTTATWGGYTGDWYNITFNQPFALQPGETYHYEIRTGSYPQIIHRQTRITLDDSFINCTSFVDVNGNVYEDWIPAIKLFTDEGEGY